jgi:GGDEF domain-containing protein
MHQANAHIDSAQRPTVVFFALAPEFRELAATAQVPALVFDNHLEYRQKGAEPSCFIIGTLNGQQACKLLKSLRSDPATALKPIFLLKSLGDSADPLADGTVENVADALRRSREIERLLIDLNSSGLTEPGHGGDRLLAFLYTRPDYLLIPRGNRRHDKYYHYPIVEAFAENAGETLAGLLQRNLLIAHQLIDRLRHCPKCDGVHLNYIDTCPGCGGIDIVQKPFLHCFACGNVGPEEKFFSQHLLVCPQCAARLRHIGADYDRPLENFQCNGCSQVFIDPVITARCMHCRHVTTPDTLVPRGVHALRLTEKGRLTARTGEVADVFAVLDDLNNVTPVYFESILDWLLSLCRRHRDEQFSLVAVRIANIVELTDRFGRARVRELMDEFARRVRELIRSTDLTTRTDRHTLWLLLPKTHAEGKGIVTDRILSLRADDDTGLSIVTAGFHAPSQMLSGESAKLLLTRIEAEIVD